jgi:lipid-binding SYLF domain-containing protein
MKYEKLLPVAVLALSLATPAAAATHSGSDPAQLVDEARSALLDFEADPSLTGFRENVTKAKAVLVVPHLVRAGFLFGGAGGSGALLARDAATGAWSHPAFYKLGSASFGAQIGGDVAQVVFLIMTEKGLDSMLATSLKLGADVEVAAGPVGTGTKTVTADILSYARTRGFFGGATIDGAVIATRDGWNEEYYGRSIRPIEILFGRSISQPHADALRSELAKITGTVAESPPVARYERLAPR